MNKISNILKPIKNQIKTYQNKNYLKKAKLLNRRFILQIYMNVIYIVKMSFKRLKLKKRNSVTYLLKIL
jgi:hypothetical protein